VLPLALSTGHKVGLAVVGACFIAFALASALLLPRFRPQFPGRGLPAFIVVTFVFFVGMLTAVSVFGAEPKETKKSENAAQTFPQTQPTTAGTSTTQTTATASAPAPSAAKARVVQASEKEFKITLATTKLEAGPVTFEVKNVGAIPHDFAIVGGPKTPLIAPGKSATLTTTLKAGPLEIYCTVPGHKQAGMDLKLTVAASSTITAKPAKRPAAKSAAKQQVIPATETEFKITLSTKTIKAGKVTFDVKNAGAIPHDLAIVGGPKTPLIPPGKSATLTTTLKAGPLELYCTVPGHKQAGMDLKLTVT
jgi:uncharacterized cupredoxin-like copper-binding protein